MVLFDFEQSAEKSILTLSGTLKKEDAEDLKRILLNSLNGTSRLVIDLRSVTEISLSCKKIFLSVHHQLENTGKHLIFTGESNH